MQPDKASGLQAGEVSSIAPDPWRDRQRPYDYDAVVVGASVAGCTVATFLGRQGARVALLERSPNVDVYKVICTHAIMPSATGTLHRLGLVEQIEAAGGVRNAADLWTRRGWVRPRSPAGVKDLPYGYNIRRERLDPMIRSLAARTDGVDYVPGATVTELIRDQAGRPSGVRAAVGGKDREVRARVVIGADGRDSKVAELAGLPAKVKPNARFAYFAHYENITVPSAQPMTLWNLEPGGASAFVNDEGITVMACMPTKDQLPEFREDLEGAFVRYFADLHEGPDLSAGRRVTKIMGRLDMSNIRRRASGPGVALVGDAAQATDPLVGVGCGWALQSGEWLATELDGALSSERDVDRALARYRRRHRRALAVHHWMISDYSTGRPLNPMERMLFTAAPRDQHVARALHLLLSRMATPQRTITPSVIARAAWVSARVALTSAKSA
jgi:flavin-dependent dehydrogenase